MTNNLLQSIYHHPKMTETTLLWFLYTTHITPMWLHISLFLFYLHCTREDGDYETQNLIKQMMESLFMPYSIRYCLCVGYIYCSWWELLVHNVLMGRFDTSSITLVVCFSISWWMSSIVLEASILCQVEGSKRSSKRFETACTKENKHALIYELASHLHPLNTQYNKVEF